MGVKSLRNVIQTLKKNIILTNADIDLKNSLSGIPLALLRRLQTNRRFDMTTKTAYPTELKSFAMTLQFYSLKAYEYVRKTFNHALPHQATIRKWLSKINCDLGFSQSALGELKRKVE